MRIIKTYVLGGYVRGKPDYGEVRRLDTDEVVYICDFGIPLTVCAKRCAEWNGWKFRRKYFSKKEKAYILEFEAP